MIYILRRLCLILFKICNFGSNLCRDIRLLKSELDIILQNILKSLSLNNMYNITVNGIKKRKKIEHF